MNKEPVLCYISGNVAYFTTQDLDRQWGDDWNDAPYEHNAGSPYQWSGYDGKPYEITRLYYESWLETPEQLAGFNSWLSVEDINKHKKAPWLSAQKYTPERYHGVEIHAGIPIADFVKQLEELGDTVMFPRDSFKWLGLHQD